ncbi:MAG: hypothetical protein CME19_11720 [Gemmatimonadetes bacterium]|nr:hypothetical protein [Gemmatimonadota bacterium]
MIDRLRFIALTVFLPGALNVYAYFGFVPYYTKDSFSVATFLAQYESSVFRYRILGQKLLLAIHDALLSVGYTSNFDVHILDPVGTGEFYFAYFFLNTSALIATALALGCLLRLPCVRATAIERDLLTLVLVFFLVGSQFVVVPYDQLSYFFLVMGAFALLWSGPYPARLTILVLSVILGTMTRESTALLLSLCGALLGTSLAREHRIDRRLLSLLVGYFIATYVGLRIWLGSSESAVSETVRFHQHFGKSSLISLIFAASAYLVLVHGKGDARLRNRFLLFASPYLLAILLFGQLAEIRLWMPLLLPFVVLSRLDITWEERPAS